MKNKYSLLTGLGSFIFRMKTVRHAATFMILFFGLGISLQSQDLIKLTSGKELKVSIIEESNDIIKYREYENSTGPVYSINRNKVESISYKKGSGQTQNTKAKETEKEAVIATNPSLQGNGKPQLTVKKRYILLDGVKQSARSVKTIMEDNPEAIKLYESGKRMCDLSNGCAIGIIITSFITSSIANKQEDNADTKKISAIGLGIDGAFIITALILSSSGKQKIRKSVALFNSGSIKPVTYNLNIGMQDYGIGVGLMF